MRPPSSRHTRGALCITGIALYRRLRLYARAPARPAEQQRSIPDIFLLLHSPHGNSFSGRCRSPSQRGALFTDKTQLLVLIAFVIGLAPDLFILAMARKAFQAIKVFGHKGDPKRKTRPTALPLLMIDDLTKDKIDRLNELGIDSAQVLACQNPFLIWPRVPYDLGLVVDWIASAQLYVTRQGDGAEEAAGHMRQGHF